jgi:hypothetical protein
MSRGSKERTAGEMGIFGGSGGEPPWSFWIVGQKPGDGMIKDGTFFGSVRESVELLGDTDRAIPTCGNIDALMS